jgi:ribosomal protein S24E
MPITSANIENDFNNKLLKRREMLISLEYDASTPSREEIKKTLADKFNLKQENMVVVRESQIYGTKKGRVLIHEYSDKEAMKIAQKHTLARPNPKKGAETAPQQGAAPAKNPNAEKKEEKKEEKKTEEKKE